MKNFWIFLLFSCALSLNVKSTFGQSDTLHLYQSYHSFSNEEKAEWTAFENNWNYVEYTELKQKHKIKKYQTLTILIIILIKLIIIIQTLPINKTIHRYINNKTNIDKLINIF